LVAGLVRPKCSRQQLRGRLVDLDWTLGMGSRMSFLIENGLLESSYAYVGCMLESGVRQEAKLYPHTRTVTRERPTHDAVAFASL